MHPLALLTSRLLAAVDFRRKPDQPISPADPVPTFEHDHKYAHTQLRRSLQASNINLTPQQLRRLSVAVHAGGPQTLTDDPSTLAFAYLLGTWLVPDLPRLQFTLDARKLNDLRHLFPDLYQQLQQGLQDAEAARTGSPS